MSKSWKRKTILVIIAALVGVYLLVPTVFDFTAKREAFENEGKPIPWFMQAFPKQTLNLGLDLRGGIYVEMEVDIPDAAKKKLDYIATDIENYLKDKKIPYTRIFQPKEEQKLVIEASNQKELEEIQRVINSDYREILTVRDTNLADTKPSFTVSFTDKYMRNFSGFIVKQAITTIRNRIDRYGVSEPSIVEVGDNRIAIELPGVSDPDRAISVIKTTGQLEFKLVDESMKPKQVGQMVDEVKKENSISENYSQETVAKINTLLKDKIPEHSEIAFEIVRDPSNGKVVKGIPYLIKTKAELTGDMLENAMANVSPQDPNEWVVNLSLDKTGTKLFADLTASNVGKALAIVLDGNVMKAPKIREAIPSGRAQIELGAGYQEGKKEAQDLVLVLQEGSLPAKLHEATKSVVGPTLGKDSIRQGIKASFLAALAVFVFMIIYYKLSGVWADMALIVNIVLLLAILSLFQATLTLPGIAGIVLTIGIAVDANVIINERIREELALGRSPKAAVDNGYANALSAVIDANITTLIAGLVLYQFGTGPIKGFAVTLSIGILTTLFTAIIITRQIYDWRVLKGNRTKISI